MSGKRWLSGGVALGTCLGPAGVLGYSLVGRFAPPGHTVEAFTTITAAGLSAVAVGACVAGAVADRFGTADALMATAAGAPILALQLGQGNEAGQHSAKAKP